MQARLYELVTSGHYEAANEFIQSHPTLDFNYTDPERHCSYLTRAALSKSSEASVAFVRHVLSHSGFTMIDYLDKGATAFERAASSGHVEMVRMISDYYDAHEMIESGLVVSEEPMQWLYMKAQEAMSKKSEALARNKRNGPNPEKIRRDERALYDLQTISMVIFKRTLAYAIIARNIELLEALSRQGIVTSRGFFGGQDPVAFARDQGNPEVVAWFRRKISSEAAFDTSLGLFAESKKSLAEAQQRLDETQIAYAEERRALYDEHLRSMTAQLKSLGGLS